MVLQSNGLARNSALFTLRLLGSPSLKGPDGTTPPSLGWGKPLALLAFLAVRGEARRDEIVDLLWRNVDEAKARNAFRQALHRLRSALGDALIPQDREVLRLARSDALVIDLHRFDSAAASSRIEEAIELYRGDFLDGVVLDEPAFDLWSDQERNRLRGQFRGLLERAVASAQADGGWTEAIATSRRLIEVAPLDEGAARTAAMALLSAGRRAEARDVLSQLESRLSSELGVPLPAEAKALLTRLERTEDGGVPARATAPATPALAFAGREPELSRLLSLWRVTGEDSGTLALIEGEAGIGKSRLAQELVAHARSLRRTTVLGARERAVAAQVPFALFADAFRPLVRAAGIVGASRHLLAEASRLLPELRDSMDLPALASIEDEAARVRFFEGIAALVDAAAYEQPLLIVLDDLQYIGPSSLDLLSYLTARLAGSAVMFVLVFRSSDAPVSTASRLRALAGGGEGAGFASPDRAIRLTLGPLDRTAMAIAIDAAALEQRVGNAVVGRIIDRADGVPGHLSELLRRAAAGDDIAQLPVSVRALVQDRLQRLSSSQRRAFLVLGLLARPVSLKTLAAAAHLSEAATRETVDALVGDGFVERADGHVQADQAAADVALEIAGPASRAFLSGWIAEALSGDPRTPAAELARFHSMAGRSRDAWASSRQAAFAAMRIGAWPEAVQHLQVARTFAGDAASAADIEGLLAALGAGNLRIPSAAGEEPVLAGAASTHEAAALTASRFERWFPNWRVLLGAAVATLVISAFVMWRTPARAAPRPSAGDTLVVVEGDPGRVVRYVTGDLVAGFTLSEPFDRPRSVPAWADSLVRPWTSAMVGPSGQLVALTRVGPGGADAYVISADRRDTVALTNGEGDARALGWSPDGRWVLVATAPVAGGAPDADLFAMRADGGGRVPLDTADHRSVVEAQWSPDGSRIAWVARVGSERQQEIFLSLADGSGVENLTRHPADDYHVSWSGDGDLLGFTSMRDGNAELYAITMRERRLWRLTRDAGQDDWARFAPSGRLVAFESTRGGTLGVFVMAALGGEPVKIGNAQALSVQDWRAGRPRYVEHVRVAAARLPEPGDTVALRISAVDQFGDSIGASAASVTVLDSMRARIIVDSATGTRHLVGRQAGLVRIVADVGRWRFDTASVRVGSAPLTLSDGPARPAEWRVLGDPRPGVGSTGVALNGDREWESGILSRLVVPVVPGLSVSVSLSGAFASASAASSTVSIALVAPEHPTTLDSLAPQFLRHASLTWDADARRTIYAVGREVFSQQALLESESGPVMIEIRVEPDSTVSFGIAGRQRWRSTLKLVGARSASRAQLWIGGRSTGAIRVSGVRVMLGGP